MLIIVVYSFGCTVLCSAVVALRTRHDATMIDCLVIGAGIAGLTAARGLQRAGLKVTVLEKSRGFGGRAATRRVDGDYFDHGAQYFTVRSEAFGEFVERLAARGGVRVWSPGFHKFQGGRLHGPEAGHPRYICPDGMNTLGKVLADGLNVRRETRVIAIKKEGQNWVLGCDTGESYCAPRCLIAIPAAQALELTAPVISQPLQRRLASVRMAPCFALALGFAELLPLPFDGVSLDTGALSWIAHDSAKRTDPYHSVVMLHSSAEFAREHFETDAAIVKDMLLEAFRQTQFTDAKPLWHNLQRWRYALAETHIKAPYLQEGTLYFAGDWCGGARLEAAYLSGLAAAEAITH
jgi:renalase